MFFILQVVAVHDLSSIYRVPLLLEEQGVLKFLLKRLDISHTSPISSHYLHKWKNLSDRYVYKVYWLFDWPDKISVMAMGVGFI